MRRTIEIKRHIGEQRPAVTVRAEPRTAGPARSASGTAPANMNGCRRPSRDQLLSEIEPTSGSMRESTARATNSEMPARLLERPQTDRQIEEEKGAERRLE